MAAIAPPAAAPIVVTVVAAPVAATIHVHFLAGSQMVMSFPCLNWEQPPAPPGGGHSRNGEPQATLLRRLRQPAVPSLKRKLLRPRFKDVP